MVLLQWGSMHYVGAFLTWTDRPSSSCGCRCPGTLQVLSHQQPPCWLIRGYRVTWTTSHNLHVALEVLNKQGPREVDRLAIIVFFVIDWRVFSWWYCAMGDARDMFSLLKWSHTQDIYIYIDIYISIIIDSFLHNQHINHSQTSHLGPISI